jgi:hypothetical protein
MSGTSEQTAPNNTPATAPMIRHRLQYQLDSQLTINILLIALIILILSIGMFIFVQFGTRTPPLHFKLNDNLQIIEPVPLDQEGISKAALLNWINESLTASFSFNYSNVSKQESKVSGYYSQKALATYLNMLNTDEDFSTIKEHHYVVSVHPTSAPEIITGKAFKGRYAWQIQIPAKIIFSNAMVRASQDITMEYLVWRVPETESPLGVTIANFNRTVVGRVQAKDVDRVFQ